MLTLEKLIKIDAPELLNPNIKIKLMRHRFRDDFEYLKKEGLAIPDGSDGRFQILRGEDKLNAIRVDPMLAEIACAEQGDDVLGDANITLAFAATGSKTAEFIGAFRIVGKMDYQKFLIRYEGYCQKAPERYSPPMHEVMIRQMGFSSQPRPTSHFYDLERINVLEELERRLIIQWDSPISWVQRKLDKEIVEIRPKGFVREFPGLLDFTLPFSQLREIVKAKDGNPEWVSKLSAVAGIYVILDRNTGLQYIGKAAGNEGFWGRWCDYAGSGHGGNKELRELLEKYPGYEINFQISILRVMDKASHPREFDEAESLIKQKLGTRVHGLNSN
jgi:hypothetical protein